MLPKNMWCHKAVEIGTSNSWKLLIHFPPGLQSVIAKQGTYSQPPLSAYWVIYQVIIECDSITYFITYYLLAKNPQQYKVFFFQNFEKRICSVILKFSVAFHCVNYLSTSFDIAIHVATAFRHAGPAKLRSSSFLPLFLSYIVKLVEFYILS